jgi:LysM repeat protein
MMRCRRCERMYDEGRPAECRYHPGRYVGAGAYALLPHWTCCGNEMQLGGCRSAGAHVQCETTRLALASFICAPASVGTAPSISEFGAVGDDELTAAPARGRSTLVFEMPDSSIATGAVSSTSTSAPAGELRAVEEEDKSSSPQLQPTPAALPAPAGRSAPADPDAVVEGRYVVLPTDTFSAVALRHGMTADALAELNNTSVTRCLMPGMVLRIVRPALSDEDEEARKRREMVLKFRRTQQCSVEEAKYYLETNEFAWDTAVAERSADVTWEREHKKTEQRRIEEAQAAELEAKSLLSALEKSATRRAKLSSWPTFLRPWENQLVRRCVLASN